MKNNPDPLPLPYLQAQFYIIKQSCWWEFDQRPLIDIQKHIHSFWSSLGNSGPLSCLWWFPPRRGVCVKISSPQYSQFIWIKTSPFTATVGLIYKKLQHTHHSIKSNHLFVCFVFRPILLGDTALLIFAQGKQIYIQLLFLYL